MINIDGRTRFTCDFPVIKIPVRSAFQYLRRHFDGVAVIKIHRNADRRRAVQCADVVAILEGHGHTGRSTAVNADRSCGTGGNHAGVDRSSNAVAADIVFDHDAVPPAHIETGAAVCSVRGLTVDVRNAAIRPTAIVAAIFVRRTPEMADFMRDDVASRKSERVQFTLPVLRVKSEVYAFPVAVIP